MPITPRVELRYKNPFFGELLLLPLEGGLHMIQCKRTAHGTPRPQVKSFKLLLQHGLVVCRHTLSAAFHA